MHYSSKVVSILALAALFAGPLQADSGSQQDSGQQWQETLESLKSYTAEQRDKAVEAGKSTLEAMDRRIEELESWTAEQWDSLSEETRDERAAALDYMRKQRNEAAEWYGGMKHSSAETWDSVKQGFIKSYDKLESAYEDAAESVKQGADPENQDQ